MGIPFRYGVRPTQRPTYQHDIIRYSVGQEDGMGWKGSEMRVTCERPSRRSSLETCARIVSALSSQKSERSAAVYAAKGKAALPEDLRSDHAWDLTGLAGCCAYSCPFDKTVMKACLVLLTGNTGDPRTGRRIKPR